MFACVKGTRLAAGLHLLKNATFLDATAQHLNSANEFLGVTTPESQNSNHPRLTEYCFHAWPCARHRSDLSEWRFNSEAKCLANNPGRKARLCRP